MSASLFRLGASACAVAACSAANAATSTFTTSLTNGVQSATATFTFDNGGGSTVLDIKLTNDMSMTGMGSNPQWLQGLFFDIAGAAAADLKASYAGLGGTTSDAFNDLVNVTDGGMGLDSVSPYTPVAGEAADHFWGARSDIAPGELPFGSQQYGLASAGFGVFGLSSMLNFKVGGPTPQPDGPDGGILSGSKLATGIDLPAGITSKSPFVDGGLWLQFDLGAYDFSTASVQNVNFVFGTSFAEVALVPLPASGAMGAAGLALLALRRRRRRVA